MNNIISFRKPSGFNIIIAYCIFVLAACEQKNDSKQTEPVLVSVADVSSQTIPVYLDFPGSIEAVKSVELLARVEGFLLKRNFEEGSTVMQGDLLYSIDPKPYQAALKKTQGQLAQTQAALFDAQLKLKRQKELLKKDFVSQQAYDNIKAQVKEYHGQITADQAAVDEAKLNLSYCSVYAPFTGRIGYTEVNVGNLVTPDKNPKLASLVQMDPIYVVFSPSDTLLSRLAMQQSKAPIQVDIFFNDNSRYALQGSVDSIDNSIDISTNTIKMRAVLPNPQNVLIPGEYIKVRASLGNHENTLLVPQAALDQQQDGYQVFLVNADGTVTAQSVTLGATYKEMRVILEGVKPGQQVVVSGMQKLKNGTRIKVQTAITPNQASKSQAAIPATSEPIPEHAIANDSEPAKTTANK